MALDRSSGAWWDASKAGGSADMVALAGRYTALRTWARREWAGPCPRCGGTDRFHVHLDGWWKCYRCHPRRARAVAFLRWVEGIDGSTALERLDVLGPIPRPSQATLTPARVRPEESPRNPRWQARAQRECAAAEDRLASAEGRPARAYLAERGILPVTWQTWGLGFGRPWHPRLRERHPALVIPWREAGQVMAIQYRFLPPTEEPVGDRVSPDAPLAHGDRFSQKAGGERRIYGCDLLGPAKQALMVVEGELNALSIWQILRGYPGPHAGPPALDLGEVDVLSFGSESGATSAWLRELAGSYARAWLWADRPERAAAGASLLRGAGVAAAGIVSPDGQDANDLLRAGQLARYLAAQFASIRP